MDRSIWSSVSYGAKLLLAGITLLTSLGFVIPESRPAAGPSQTEWVQPVEKTTKACPFYLQAFEPEASYQFVLAQHNRIIEQSLRTLVANKSAQKVRYPRRTVGATSPEDEHVSTTAYA